jgi:hypothetical protein
MKKIVLGLFALTVMSTTAVYANGGKKKAKKKAKSCCTKTCTDKKDCKPTSNCVPMPGCCRA